MSQTIILSTFMSRRKAEDLVSAAPSGSVLTIKAPSRTSDQNAKMQAMLSDISRAKPGGRVLRPDQWKCLVMDAVAEETGNDAFRARWEPGLTPGSVVNLGHRSSRLSKAEMSEMIEWMYAWGAEQGIEWTEPRREGEAA